VKPIRSVALQPAGLRQALERVESIKARFRTPRASFAATLMQTARAPEPALHGAIAATAQQYGIDPAVLTALAHAESGFRPEALSADGAMGLTQLMPATAKRLGVLDPFDLQANLDGGARYLKEQLDRFSGDLTLALAAYNAGPGAVLRFGGMPPYGETQRFVSRVLELTRRYAGKTQ